MEIELAQQYNGIAQAFVDGNVDYNEFSRNIFYNILNTPLVDKKLLDVGCGYGFDLAHFKRQGAQVFGIDASTELVKLAQVNVPRAEILEGFMENLPYQDSTFDLVVSKYVLQTSTDLLQVIREMSRVLKPGGTLAYLAVHPLRQFLEKKKHPKDYFLQEVVKSNFFEGTVKANEPTHTLEEYLNQEFLSTFRLTHFREYADFPSAERIDGDNYPCFFVLKADKLK